MIIDNIAQIERYYPLGNLIQKSLCFIKENESKSLKKGTYEIEGNNAFAVVIQKETIDVKESQMESHQKYMDIHFILEGEELLGYSSEMIQESEYNLADDIMFGHSANESFHRLKKGDFYILWPREAHRVLGKVSEEHREVKKIICKVLIDE